MSRTLEAVRGKRYSKAMSRVERATRAVDTSGFDAAVRRMQEIDTRGFDAAVRRMQEIDTRGFDAAVRRMQEIDTRGFDAAVRRMQEIDTRGFDAAVRRMQEIDTRGFDAAVRRMQEIDTRGFDAAVRRMQEIDTRGFDAAVRRMQEIDTRGFDAAVRQISEVQLDLGALAARLANVSQRAIQERRRTLDELKRYAQGLECDSLEEFRDAGVFLRQAVEEFEDGVENADEYAFAFAYRLAVGALEEVARRLAGDGRMDLRRALTVLILRRLISQHDREWLVEVYELRNTQRGLGHGAGRCPEYTASFALSVVLRGLEALIPSSELASEHGPEDAPVTGRNQLMAELEK